MAINKKLITFAKKEHFLGATNGIGSATSATNGFWNNIPSYSIVFIKETGEIWHNGTYYGKPISSQINPADSGQNAGLVFRLASNGNYYYRTMYFWGNTVDGSDPTINDDLIVNDRWLYGQGEISYKNNNNAVTRFLTLDSTDFSVTVPNGNFLVSGGTLTVSDLTEGQVFNVSTGGVIVAKSSISGSKILNTHIYYNTDFSLGKTWTSIKQFDSSKTAISLATTMPAIINIQAHNQNNDWQPWIAGGDSDSGSSWGIGLSGDNFYIGRVSKDQSSNALTNYWKFDSSGNFVLGGKISNGTYEYTLPSNNGTLALVSNIPTKLSDLTNDLDITSEFESVFSLSVAKLSGRVTSIEDWLKNPQFENLFAEELNVLNTINGTSANALKLENHAASYFATDSNLTSAINRISSLENTIATYGGAVTYDISTSVTENETKLITSGAVFSAIANALSAVMHFKGLSTTEVTNSGSEPATINGNTLSPLVGDVVLYDGLEFAWDGTKWIQLGDESSFVLKTVQVVAGSGLTGGGALSSNVTLSLTQAVQDSLALADSAIQSADLANYVNDIETTGTGDYIASVSKSGKKITFTLAALPTTIELSKVTNADNLKAIEALTGSGLLKRNLNNTWSLDTTTYLTINDLFVLSEGISENYARITSIEDWLRNPEFYDLHTEILNTEELNLNGRSLQYISGVLKSNEVSVFSDLSNNGNLISITVGGQTNTLAVKHADLADSATAATSATSATKDSSGNTIVDTYETKVAVKAIENVLTSGISTLESRIISIEDWLALPRIEDLYSSTINVETQINLGGLTLKSDGKKLYIGDTGVYLEVINGDIYTNAGIFMNTTN